MSSKPMQLSAALTWGRQQLKASSDTAKLDAELLLIDILHCSRAQLIAFPERMLTPAEFKAYQHFMARRRRSEPLAYIVEHKEFWSLDLRVTPATLIPRPETELLVELLLQFFAKDKTSRRIADLGTGCGAVALALSQERPIWEVYATDQSEAALVVAKQNAATFGIKGVQFFQGSWCAALPSVLFDAILSNPPYLSEAEWKGGQKELCFEPVSALVSKENGFQDLREITRSAKEYLQPGGYLLLEHGSEQAAEVRRILQKEAYLAVCSYHDLAGRERVTGGRWAI